MTRTVFHKALIAAAAFTFAATCMSAPSFAGYASGYYNGEGAGYYNGEGDGDDGDDYYFPAPGSGDDYGSSDGLYTPSNDGLWTGIIRNQSNFWPN